MTTLIERLRKAREIAVDVGEWKFTIRRPTDAEALEIHDAKQGLYLEVSRRAVVDWNLRELDLIPGGGAEPVPFSRELWLEFCADHAEIWQPIAEAALLAYADRQKSRAVVEKN